MKIGPHTTEERVIVVAEIGNNHEGDPGVARELVERAVQAGAHAVKLQVFNPGMYVAPSQPDRVSQLERFRLAPNAIEELAQLARSHGLGFVATAFDLASADFLEPLVDAFKIASGDNDIDPFLERAAASGKPVIVSTGMCGLKDIAHAKDVVERRWGANAIDGELALLHCVSAYPTPPEHAALATIPTLYELFGCTIGYSDHTLGPAACVTAAALGARILEKHLTLSHTFSDFRDHQLSAEPEEFNELVRRVESVERLIGTPRDGVFRIEEDVAAAARRCVRAARDLAAGHALAATDLIWLRPREGIELLQVDELLGRTLKRDLNYGEPLSPYDVEQLQ